MASNVHVSVEGRNAAVDAVAALLNGGTLKFYSGTQPANAGTALSGNTMLVSLGFSATAFGAASSGSATANSITGGTIAADGTATFARLFKSNGTSVVLDCSVGTSGADITVPTTTFNTGVDVTMSSATLSMAA